MAVKVVTDSTSEIPRDLAQSLGITIVPLEVNLGTEVFKDGVDLSSEEFFRRLTEGGVHPTTSQPPPGEFIQAYEELSKEADAIVSIHISSKLSGTLNSAEQAKTQADIKCPVEIVDSLHASIGLGMITIAAAHAANDGASLDEVTQAARGAMSRAQCFPLLDTLEFLQKGGRVGKAQALIGSILKIKPIITVKEGEVHPLGKVRTFAKGVAKLQELARGYAPIEELCVLHSTTPDAARDLAESLRDLLPEGKEPFVSQFGPALGVHVGPGALGVGLLQTEGAAAPDG